MAKSSLKKRRLDTPWGISFFSKKDWILPRKYRVGELFESQKKNINNFGQVTLSFFKPKRSIYSASEKAYAIDQYGRVSVGNATDIARYNFYEIIVTLLTPKKVEEDQILCSLWIKDTRHAFTTFLDLKPNTKNLSSALIGGFLWWPTSHEQAALYRLFVPNDIRLLSNMYVTMKSVPRLYKKADDIQFLELYYEE